MKRSGVNFFKSFRMKVAIALVGSMVLVSAVSDFLISKYAFERQFNQLRTTLMIIAQIAASDIEVDTLLKVPLGREGIQSSAFKSIADKLIRIKTITPLIRYIYIMSKTDRPNILKFVVDPEAIVFKEGEATSYPGDIYDASSFPELLKAFGGPSADRKLGKDEWGVFLSGYAPIMDREGAAVAVLGVDLDASNVHTVQREMHKRALLILLLGIIIAIALALIIAQRVTNPVEKLVGVTQHIAKGNLHHYVKVRGEDEIAQLAKSFNKMSADLRKYIEDLRRTTAEKERLQKELEIARGIQQRFLPQSAPKIKHFDIAAKMLPAREVGGDFYDFIPLEDGRLVLVVGDVSGKGIPAAIFMAFSRTLIRATTSGDVSAVETIQRANKMIFEESRANMFVTLFYAILDPDRMTLKYINAGHNPPLVVKDKASDILFLKAQGVPLGIIEDAEVSDKEIELKKGDILVLYTDGVTEALNRQHEQFEIERLSEMVSSHRTMPAYEMMNRVQQALEDFSAEEPQFDDITLMMVKAV